MVSLMNLHSIWKCFKFFTDFVMKNTSLSFCTWSQPSGTAIVLILKMTLIDVTQHVLKSDVMEINKSIDLKIIGWESLSGLQGVS